ncbi:MAG: hypothetical protein ACRDBP_07490 [Luteolibacter sp.]
MRRITLHRRAVKYLRCMPRERQPQLVQALEEIAAVQNLGEHPYLGIGKPIGIAEYQLVRALPGPLDTCLPGIEEIEAEPGRIGEEESGTSSEKC